MRTLFSILFIAIINIICASASATLIFDGSDTNVIQIDQPITINNNQTSAVVTQEPSTVLFQTVVDQATYVTNLVDQFNGVNVFTPQEVNIAVQDEWVIDLTTNNPVGMYVQTGNITSVVFNVDSTNDVALGEVLFQATTNAITWPTNGLTWAAGAAPTLTTGQWSILYFRAWRDDVHAVYVGDTP